MTNFTDGRRAEAAAAEHLRRQGYEVVEQNWRTRWCEIDIVARRHKVMYFCEVKYRASDRQGGGLDYITPKKLQQMRFAAEFWAQMNTWKDEYQLMAIEVYGPDFEVTSLVDDP